VNDSNRAVLLVVVLVILVPVLWGTVMMGTMGGGMIYGWGDGNGWSPWQGVLATLSTLLVIGGIGAVTWWAFGRADDARPPGPGPVQGSDDDARAILDARYARGDLTREQYQQMRRDLES
jgi:putative membrane protein